MPDKAYQPVSCALHSELELAIMHGQQLLIECRNTNTALSIKPTDIITRSMDKDKNKAEFLSTTELSGKQHEIRLDMITKITLQP